MSYRKQSQDPRIITAMYDCKCSETEKEIKQGEKCVYYPSSQTVFHQDSKQAQTFREWKFDLECLRVEF